MVHGIKGADYHYAMILTSTCSELPAPPTTAGRGDVRGLLRAGSIDFPASLQVPSNAQSAEAPMMLHTIAGRQPQAVALQLAGTVHLPHTGQTTSTTAQRRRCP